MIEKVKFWTPDQPLRALSWKQPFAELMLHGKIETRTWSTKYRGWVLICAGKTPYNIHQTYEIAGDIQLSRIQKKMQGVQPRFGQAIAMGRLVDCRPMRQQDKDACFVEYFGDLYCHVYDNVHPIIPFDWRGSQGWREVPPEVKEKIAFLL